MIPIAAKRVAVDRCEDCLLLPHLLGQLLLLCHWREVLDGRTLRMERRADEQGGIARDQDRCCPVPARDGVARHAELRYRIGAPLGDVCDPRAAENSDEPLDRRATFARRRPATLSLVALTALDSRRGKFDRLHEETSCGQGFLMPSLDEARCNQQHRNHDHDCDEGDDKRTSRQGRSGLFGSRRLVRREAHGSAIDKSGAPPKVRQRHAFGRGTRTRCTSDDHQRVT